MANAESHGAVQGIGSPALGLDRILDQGKDRGKGKENGSRLLHVLSND